MPAAETDCMSAAPPADARALCWAGNFVLARGVVAASRLSPSPGAGSLALALILLFTRSRLQIDGGARNRRL
jgi:hypothetical protein